MITKEINVEIESDETGYDVWVNGEKMIGFDHPCPPVQIPVFMSLLRIAYEAGKEGLVMKVEEVVNG